MKKLLLFLLTAFMFSCSNHTANTPVKDSVTLIYKDVATTRTAVNPNPVQSYTETVKSFETTDEFKVALFETKETFHYLVKINYKNLEEEDTLKVPNFGVEPSVKIIKGDKRPSCVIGFLDEEKQFRESKLIYYENNTLKVHVLKHYGVATYQKVQ